MPKLYSANYGRNLLQTLKNQFKITGFLSSISQLHCPGENQNEFEQLQSSASITQTPKFVASETKMRQEQTSAAFQIEHPWPEWVGLMEMLLKKGYFDEIGFPFQNGELGPKDSNLIRTACLNFGRDRFDLVRYLSRKDIKVVVESGCPTVDRKVVNSGKRLRAHVGMHEGSVCGSCSLRGHCDRAYIKARKDEGGRTVDAMRILLTFGLDHITRSVENKPCQNETVQQSVRRLLKALVELSQNEPDPISNKGVDSSGQCSVQTRQIGQIEVPMKQGDWICPKCNFLNFAKNMKCLRCNGVFQDRLKKMNEDQDHLPLKKGDWICEKCNFLNFARNSKCLQCQENPPKRQLNLGEWECDSCRYINFRKNMVCLRCDHKRPKASKSSNPSAEVEHEKQDNGHQNRVSSTNGEVETNSQSPAKQEHISSNMWRFVEDGTEDQDQPGAANNYILEFIDFPIQGGRSELSRGKDKIEKWKLEMAERKRNAAKGKAQQFHSVTTRSMFLKCVDDDELAEWFGQGKGTETGRLHPVLDKEQD
ncbi:hypothetical protein Ancab_018389 [Ancistrocladus abbreviatus]